MKLAFTVISIILRRTVKTSWMEVTAMKEKVQMNKTGKFASYLKTVQTAGKKIRANIFIRILNPRKVKWGKKCESSTER